MTNNPYKSPNSELGTPDGKPQNSKWWKAFFWITFLFTLLGFIVIPFLDNLALYDYVDFALTVVVLVGLYGFSHYKQVGKVIYWRYIFYIALIQSIIFVLVFPLLGIPRYGSDTIDLMYFFEIAYTLIILLALNRYAYKVPFVWHKS